MHVLVDNKHLVLTPIEFRILLYLALRAGSVVSWEEIVQSVWELEPTQANCHLVDVHLGRIRHKFRLINLTDPSIVTVRRKGFVLSASSEYLITPGGVIS